MARTENKVIKEAKRFYAAWSAANTNLYGAAVSYYSVFAIAPLIIIALLIAGLVFDKASAQQSVLAQISSTLGSNASILIQQLIAANHHIEGKGIVVFVGIILVILGATGIFSTIQSALDGIFSDFPKKDVPGLWKIFFKKLASIAMVLAVGGVLVASLLASVVLTAFGTVLNQYIPGSSLLTFVVDFFVSFFLVSFFLALMFRYLPSEHIPWKIALSAGYIAGILFMIGKYALGIYLGTASGANAYGAASSVILIILWMYYLAQVLFLSAVLAKLYFTPVPKKIRN